MFDRFKRGGGDGAVSAGQAAERDETRRRDADDATMVRDRDLETRDDGGRFSRADGDADVVAPASGGTQVHDAHTRDLGRTDQPDTDTRRDRDDRDHDVDRDGVDDRVERRAPMPARERAGAGFIGHDTMAGIRERQRDRFGGFSWGSDFFGFLCALGLASILTGILTGAGVAFGLFSQATGSSGDAQTIGIGGGIALLVVLAIAWYAGGYVAGRMARFDGLRQGVGVWLWTILLIAAVAVLAAVGGSKYNVLQSLNLPSIPVGGDTLTKAGAITAALALLTMLVFAILGGKVGERFHRKVDRMAHDEDYAYDR